MSRPRGTALSEIVLEQNWHRSPKPMAFVRRVRAHADIPRSFLREYVLRLWEHAAGCAIDGCLGEPDDEMLAEWCGWDHDASVFAAALKQTGLLERRSEPISEDPHWGWGPGWWIHDWEVWTGRLWVGRLKARERAALSYKRRKEVLREEPGVLQEASPILRLSAPVSVDVPVPVKDPPLPPQGEDARKVVEHYRRAHPTRGRTLTPRHKSWKRLERLLSGAYTVGDICLAIDANKRSAWHTEHRKQDLEFILRDSQLEDFIELGRNPPASPKQSIAEKTLRLALEGPNAPLPDVVRSLPTGPVIDADEGLPQ